MKSRRDSERPFDDEVGFLFSNFSLGCRLFISRWNSSASSTYLLFGLMKQCEDSAILSSLSMNSMAKMSDVLQPTFWLQHIRHQHSTSAHHGLPTFWEAIGLAEYAVFKAKVHVVERNMLDYGFLDVYGCV